MTRTGLPRPNAIGVRWVLAAAYRGRDIGRRTLLTHAIEVDVYGEDSRALCRVPFESLCGEASYAAPTCPVRAKRASQ